LFIEKQGGHAFSTAWMDFDRVKYFSWASKCGIGVAIEINI